MRRFHVALIALLFAVCPLALAQGTPAQSALTGNWTSRTADGIFTQFEVTANGKFVFREQYSSDPRRAYLCGRITDLGDALSLDVKAMTERLADGAIEHGMGETTMVVNILRRTDTSLVVRFQNRTIVLNLS